MSYARAVDAHQSPPATIAGVESSSTPCSHTVRYLATHYYHTTGGVEERGDRARGARHPAPAADGGGEGAQPEGGRQGALKTDSARRRVC